MDGSLEEMQCLVNVLLVLIQFHTMLLGLYEILYIEHQNNERNKRRRIDDNDHRLVQELNFKKFMFESDLSCIEHTRMDRRCFHKLCDMLKTIGILVSTKNMCVEEMVAIFLHTCAHHVKNRIMKRRFGRSGETISRHFNAVLNSILLCHEILLAKPESVQENSVDYKWKWFKNCLGALDGMYIRCIVHECEKPRYRTRKGEIAMNVLGVCNQEMQFIYILPGWEGSAADSRVLRDAISRPKGLKVPRGFYYLCDAGYTTGEGFLAPYRGQRYHLNDWSQACQPRTPHELFNYGHSSARNVIERCFGFLKMRWAILRERSFYPLKSQGRIVSACALLHNHIRREMPIDPFESEIDVVQPVENNTNEEDIIDHIATSETWTEFRENLAQQMWNEH